MYFKAPILRNFVSCIIILDTFTCYLVLKMIIRALKLKEEEKDSKRSKNVKAKEQAYAQWIACHGMCRKQKLAEAKMPQHVWKTKIGSVDNDMSWKSGCCSVQ